MTRRDEGQEPHSEGGHAAARRQQFEQERGLSGSPELPLTEAAPTGEKPETTELPDEDEASGTEDR